MRLGRVAVLMCGWQLLGCSENLASKPRLPSASAPLPEREQAYRRYRLKESGDVWWGWSWQRADGNYKSDEILPLMDISAETRSRVSQAKTRQAIVLPAAMLGGAFLGLALGNQSGGNKLFSSQTNTGLYIAGGALAVTSLTVGIAWDPITGIGDAYNTALAGQLGLPPEPGAR